MPEQANPTVSAASPPPLQYVPSRMSVWRIAAAVFVGNFSCALLWFCAAHLRIRRVFRHVRSADGKCFLAHHEWLGCTMRRRPSDHARECSDLSRRLQ